MLRIHVLRTPTLRIHVLRLALLLRVATHKTEAQESEARRRLQSRRLRLLREGQLEELEVVDGSAEGDEQRHHREEAPLGREARDDEGEVLVVPEDKCRHAVLRRGVTRHAEVETRDGLPVRKL